MLDRCLATIHTLNIARGLECDFRVQLLHAYQRHSTLSKLHHLWLRRRSYVACRKTVQQFVCLCVGHFERNNISETLFTHLAQPATPINI